MIGRRKLGYICLGAAGAAATSLLVKSSISPPQVEQMWFRFCQAESKIHAAELARRALSDGASAEDVLDAALKMNLLSDGNQSDVHAMLVVPPLQKMLRELSSGQERLCVWAVENAFNWSGKNHRAFPAPFPSVGPIVDDDPDTSAAVTRGLFEHDAKELSSKMAQLAATYGGDPHVAIWAAEAFALSETSPNLALPAWTSVARYASTRIRDADVPVLRCDASSTVSTEEIYTALRESGNTPLSGFAQQSIWEALFLLAIEVRLLDLSQTGIGVHQITTLSSRWKLSDLTHDTIPLSFAAAFVTRVHAQRAAGITPALRIPPSSEDPLTLPTSASATRRYAAGLSAATQSANEFVSRVREQVAKEGTNSHDFKFFQAIVDVSSRLSDEVRPYLLALLATSDPLMHS